MRNLKLITLLFGLCTIINSQSAFAQEDSKAAKEKVELSKARNNGDVSNLKNKELSALRKKYEEATPEQRVAIKKEITELKKSYNKEVKGQDGDHIDLAKANEEKIIKEKAAIKSEVLEKKYDMSDKIKFISNGRKRIKAAKIKLEKAEKNGELTDEELRMKKYKINLVEKKLNHHEASLNKAKAKIAKRIKEIKQLQE